jgi:CRISPR/Cas system-associated exonuclease Cas4 (RecB family)
VIDYKSGRLTTSEAEVRESLPLSIYQLLVARENPDVGVHARILCLRSGESASVLRTPAELEALEREILRVVHRILDDKEMLPVPGPRCRECLYPRICPPGRAWLRAHGTRAEPGERTGEQASDA